MQMTPGVVDALQNQVLDLQSTIVWMKMAMGAMGTGMVGMGAYILYLSRQLSKVQEERWGFMERLHRTARPEDE